MAVYKKKNNKWYCKGYVGGQPYHRLCKGATNKQQALEMEAAFMYDLKMQQLGIIPKKLKNVYFPRLKELYIRHAINNHKKFRNQVYYLNALEKYFISTKPINDVKPEDIEKYKDYLKNERGLKNSSINRYLEILSKMFNLAIDNGELNNNPLKQVQKLKEDNHIIRFLTKEEERRLFDSIDKLAPYLRPIVVTALQTGMRRSEIFSLKWCNVDFTNRIIFLTETKSGKSREIPISDELYKVLQSLTKESEYVFVNPKTNKPYVDVKKSFNIVREHAQLKDFRFHDLRHTFATRLAMVDKEPFTLMELMGHTSLQTTMRYTHVVAGRKMEAIKKLTMYIYNTEEN